jgi:hypothetical protein
MNDDRGIYLVNNYYGYADGIVEVDIYDNTANGNYCDGGPWPYMAGIGVRNYGDNLYVDIHDNVANGNYLCVYQRGTVYMDLGGGFAGSVGDNSLFGNTVYDLDNNTYGIMDAENNWWVADADPGAQINGSVDYTPWLTSAP